MFHSTSNYLFAVMLDISLDLFRSGKIEAIEDQFLRASVHQLDRLFMNLIRVLTISETADNIDFEYYMKLAYVSNGELKKSAIQPDDPFRPIYEHSENLLETLNYLKEFSNPEGSATLPKDLMVKLVLFSKETFLMNLNTSLCKQYRLKSINDPHKRIQVKLVTKYQINKIYMKYLHVQQEIFEVCLNISQKKLPEFIGELATYDRLITSYNEFCSDEKLKKINQISLTLNKNENGIPHERRDRIEIDDKSNGIANESTSVFPDGLKSEAQTLEQFLPDKTTLYDSRNFMLSERFSQDSRSHLNNKSSNSIGLYGNVSLFIFILLLLGSL
ncbi:hypothetical protein NBO_4g0022 [Nosema bombycis CQ1]|uniref:Uncharacterized protein n=1 Tax=Nosema bombycis (strain CQ1 / CVCC 102059) TaxID=578461 RepID=R0MBT5_NOSB1|nr:hypothetical protein NBO_4g0022 [Nosema bombycis CQ1]|eukprot:EOB15394.1 hypothetical protein NBO_4g0022 [Nosema bombycis CQ1]